MSNLKSRLLLIAAMIIASVWALFPRTVVERVQRDGVFVHDTIRRVPLKRGLDLQGGMHLTLEVDESKQAVTNVSDALDRALTVVRTRIDEFGVAEPIVQKVGETRITVELPGIDDRERATAVVQRSAVLRFQITDETQALERAIPRLDGIVKERGLLARAANANADTAPASSALGSLFQNPTDSAAGDSAGTSPDGPFRRLIQQGNMPGQYMVAARDVPEIERYLADSAVRTALPPGKEVRWGADSVMLGAQVFKPLYVLSLIHI